MTDIALDTNHDLLIVNGDIRLLPSKELVVLQKIKTKLLTFTGTLWNNIEYGINSDLVFRRGGTEMLDAEITMLLLEIEDVIKVIEFSSSVRDRIYTCSFKLDVTTGAIIDIDGFALDKSYFSGVDYNIWKDGKWQHSGSWLGTEIWGSR